MGKQLGITVKKGENFSEWYTQVIQRGELIEYTPVSGCIVYRPRSYFMWEKFQDWFNKQIKKRGVHNAYFPLLIPESLFKKEAEHVEGFTPEVAWVTMGGNSKLSERLAVRPTSETIMCDSFKKWVRSHRDLPLKVNQWCNVVRWEFKHPMPFIRGREYLWQEGHTLFATKEEAEKETYDILDVYEQAYKELFAIPVIKGRKSESEKFAGALYTLGVEAFVPSGKNAQAATTHCLGQHFTKAFDINFLDQEGEKKYPYHNSWGFSTRSIGICIMMHSDDNGLVLPPRVAPTQVVIVPIFTEKTQAQVLKKAQKVKNSLKKFLTELDDRPEYTPGWKFNEWELKGVPVRIELGPKDLAKKQAIVVRRDTGKKEAVKIKDLPKTVENLLEQIQEDLYKKAKKFLDESIIDAKNWTEFIKAIKVKKLARAPWCETKDCEDWIKDKSGGAKCITIPFDQPKNIKAKCIHCGKPAKVIAYFGRSY